MQSVKHPGALQKTGDFRKEIGLFSGVNVLVGIIIGSGVFYLGSYVLLNTKMRLGYALLAWIIGGLISLMGGLCFAELGAMMPRAGGMYVYMSEAYHPVVGFMNEFTSILISGAGSNAAIAIAFPTALGVLMPMSDVTIKAIAIIAIVFLSAVNYFGVKGGTLVQNIFTVAKVIPIILIIVLGISQGNQTVNLSLTISSGENFFDIVSMIALAVMTTMWAYDGWTNLNSITEEIKAPQRNLPRAIALALCLITGIYVLFNYAIYRVLPLEQIQHLIGNGQVYLGTEAAKSLLGKTGGILVALTMALSMFGSLNGCILSFPREYYALAYDGLFFKSFGKLHPKYRTPSMAIISQMVISVILVLIRNLNQLTSLVIFSSLFFKMLTIYAVLVFRKKLPDMERPYKVPMANVTVFVTCAAFLGLLFSTLQGDVLTSLIGLLIPAVGAIMYFLFFHGYYNGGERT